MKHFSKLLIAVLLSCIGQLAMAQAKFPCDGRFYMTRQYPSVTNTYISEVQFVPGDINISNPGTIAGSRYTNASVFYNGYIWTQDWTNTASSGSFKLIKVASDYSVTSYTIAGMPTGNYNNAGVTSNGIMYMMVNMQLYAIDLTLTTPAIATGFPKTCTMTPFMDASGYNWGDLAIDPTNNDVFIWYHPTGVTVAYKGLYKINNISGATPSIDKVNGLAGQVSQTMGSMMFNDKGQLFSYGSPDLTNPQDRFWAIDKQTGLVTQYGAPDLAVTQTDGCTCAFRISLEKSTSTPLINLSKCGSDSFRYIFRTDNYTLASVSGLTLRDTLDSRLTWIPDVSSLQTQLQAIYGGSVSVAVSSYGSGSNNVLTVSNMTLPVGQNAFSVPVYLTANGFSGTNILYQQAYLTGLSVDLGSTEPSDYPNTFTPHDATPITINISGSLCRNPVADNYTVTTVASRMSAVAVAAPVASDADGSISQINILTTPVNGFISYFDGINTNTITGAISLTPTQAGTLKYTPAAGAVNSTEVFTYQAVDNSGLSSNTATYAIPVRNNPPLANNIIQDEVLNTAGASAIQPLSAGDEDGIVSSYTITSIPNAGTQGTLSYCSNGSSPCTGSYIDITTAGTILTPAKAATLRFTPVVSYTGNVQFSYTATDNSSYTSNSATYIIPVHSTYSTQHQPLADNVVSQPMSNALPATGIPSLKARDVDGTISSFTIISIPNSATQGTLKLCNPSCSDVTAGQVIAAADIANLSFDPLSTFTGDATFKYIATDNESIVSDTALFTIEVVNMPPTAVNVSTTVTYNSSTAAISPIGGSDKDGTVDSAIIISLPASGTLKLCNPSCTNITLNQRIVPSNFSNLSFQPASGFTGTVTFQYKVRDNNGNYSQPATYTIQVPNSAPIADDIVNATLANTAASTGISSLTAADPDGSISSYQIQSLPLAVSGVLYVSGSPVVVGQTVTASSLQFDPAVNYTGVASFSYIAFDNNLNASNIATVQIPVSGVGNLPPVVKNIQGGALSNTTLATLLNTLTAVDPEGGVVTYNIESVPPASQGTLTYCSSGTVPCVGSTITLSGPVTGLSALQVSSIKWTPSSSFVGTAQFTYTAVDILGAKGNTAAYLLPVTNLVPAASTVLNTTLANTSGSVSINSLSSTDPDGTISNYILQTVPPAAQGALTLCNPGCAAVTANQVISPSDISNLKFDPAYTFTGDILFNYISVDNNVQRSNVAVYTIPVTSLPPVAKDVVNTTIYNIASNSPLSPMVATDADGSIASYMIHSIPAAKEGVLSLSGVPVYVNQVLSTSDISNLTFTPNQDFAGYVSFNYSAIDNLDLQSNTATVVIPVNFATLSGHVYHDANGITDNLVFGTGTNDSATYVSMVNSSNVVEAVTTVAADGSFAFRKIKTGSFTFVLSTTQGTVGSAPPVASLTSGWVNTGEHLGAGAGSDGTVNGILPVTISTQPVTEVNFGIEQLPTPSTITATTVVNPGGTTQATVPASTFAGADADGTVDSIHITSFPTNTTSIVIDGVSYTSGTFPVGGVTISAPGGVPAVSITVDPVDGAVSVDIPYVTKDNAGKESPSTGHAHQPFGTVTISGTVFDDANGNTDNMVNGVGTNAGSTLFANLIQGGSVISSVTLPAPGTYTFSNINGGSYTVVVTTSALSTGAALPANWVNTAEAISPSGSDGLINGITAVTITNASVTGVNFGIEQLPTPSTITATTVVNPGGTTQATVPASTFAGADADGTVDSIRITSFPTNTTSIVINGVSYTSGTFPVGGVTISAPGGVPVVSITVDPVDGAVSVDIPYVTKDNAGKESTSTGHAHQPFGTVTISGTVFDDANGNTDNIVNGVGTNAGSTLFANLIQGGSVISSVTLPAPGTYTFSNINGGSYTVVVTTSALSTGAALPANWVNTAEAIAPSGSDGLINGITAVTITNASVTGVNFGIEQLPTPSTITATTVVNPGGTTQATVPASTFAGNDADGTVDSIRITSFPTNTTSIVINGVSYTSGTFPVGGVTISAPGGVPAVSITVDPVDGAVSVDIPYVTKDNAGKESTSTGHAHQPFGTVTISGTVFDDANGNTDNMVNGVGTNAGSALFANLIQGGSVISSVTLPALGTYTFSNINGGSYTVVVTTSALSTGAALPTNWVNTAEAIAPSGSDGLINGITAVTVTNASVTGVNFGIEQLPTPSTITATTVVNPGGTTQAAVPASTFAGNDADGTVDSIRITSFPTNTTSIVINGVSYTSGTFPVGGVTISAPGGVPAASITVDPVDGAVSVDIPYVTKDNAGKESPATGHAHQPFNTVTLSGTLYDDYNGITDNTVNGLPISAGLNAVLVDINNIVLASVPIAGDGSYTFTDLNGGTYRVDIGMAGTPGVTAPGAWLPLNWVTTSEAINPLFNDGTPNGSQSVTITNASVSNVNFGCEKIALADPKSYYLTSGPGSAVSNVTIAGTAGEGTYGNQIVMSGTASSGYIPGQLTGNDPDGAAGAAMVVGSGASISFTIDPTSYSATDSNLNTIATGIMLLYNGIQLQAGGCQGGDIGNPQCSYYNAANGLWEIPGYTESNLTILSKGHVQGFSFSYGWKDAANKQGVTALYQVSFATPLAVHLVSFNALATGDHQATLNWRASNETYGDTYGIERSTDGIHFTELGSVRAQGLTGSSDYSYQDNDPASGINYYRLHLAGQDGSSAYSAIKSLTFGAALPSVNVYPNPVTNGSFNVALTGLEGSSVLDIFDMNGRMVRHINATNAIEQVSANGWAPGIYTVSVANNGKRYTTLVRIQ